MGTELAATASISCVLMGRTRTRCSRMPSTAPSIPTGRRTASRSPSTPKPVEATRSGSSTRTGPTPRRSCHGVPTARSAAVTSRYRPGRQTVRRSRSSGSSSARAVLEAAVIEVQDIASGDRRVLFRAPSKTALNYPRWSSDGRSIVFEMTRYPDTQINTGTATGSAIAVIDVTGEGAKPVVLTDWSMYATYPDWRPGSDEILFSTYDLREFPATDEPSNLYTIKPDGSGQTALTTFGKAEQRATQPTWTPDGSRIIFTLVGQQAGMDNPRHAAFIEANGSNIVDIGVAATHPRLRPGTP